MRTECLLVLSFTVLACAQEGGEAVEAAPSVRAAIEAQWSAHVEGGLRQDVALAMSIFAPDVVYIEPGAPIVEGFAAMEAFETETFNAWRIISQDRKVLDLRVFGTTAYEIGTNDFVLLSTADDSTLEGHAHYTVSWVRSDDGQWRIHRMVVGGL